MRGAESDLASRVAHALLSSPFIDCRWLHCEVRDGVVVLRGTLPTYYQKQMAQEHIRDLEGVGQICNEIQVQEHRRPRLAPSGPPATESFVTEWTIEPFVWPSLPESVLPTEAAA